MAERVKALAAFAEDPSTDPKGHQKAAPNCLKLQLSLGDLTPTPTLASAGTGREHGFLPPALSSANCHTTWLRSSLLTKSVRLLKGNLQNAGEKNVS